LLGKLADSQGQRLAIDFAEHQLQAVRVSREKQPERRGNAGEPGNAESEQTGLPGRPWFPREADSADWIECTDGKARPTQPGLFPLAHGIPGRVGLLRGYGNAIVPQAAAAFIDAYLDLASCLLPIT
jgi:DNA (cytosine-5)-methyltransferase 1